MFQLYFEQWKVDIITSRNPGIKFPEFNKEISKESTSGKFSSVSTVLYRSLEGGIFDLTIDFRSHFSIMNYLNWLKRELNMKTTKKIFGKNLFYRNGPQRSTKIVEDIWELELSSFI